MFEQEQGKEKAVPPLIEEPFKPKTKTQPQLQKVLPTLETALDLEDSAILDLSVQKLRLRSTLQSFVVVYIRPAREELGDLVRKGESRVSCIFEGITVERLKKNFEKALEALEPYKEKRIRGGIFSYIYDVAQRETIYESAKRLNEKHSKN